MRVWCGQSTDQLKDQTPDLIVLPEGTNPNDVEAAALRFPKAIVVGAVLEADRMRGVVWHQGANQVDYQKIGWDGHSAGGDRPGRAPVYCSDGLAVGLLICMDVQDAALRNAVVEDLRRSTARFKIVCIPAEMQAGSWFVGDDLGAAWSGMHVALSNSYGRYPDSRLPSFLTDDLGRKAVVQQALEPISISLSPRSAVATQRGS